MRIHIIRHGKTFANENKLYCGKTDISLSGNGINELIYLKKEINYPLGEIYITSGLKRANETLNILYNRENDIIINEFEEFNFGEFEMKGFEELKSNELYNQWLNDYDNYVLPNGESKKIFENRVLNGFEKIKKLEQIMALDKTNKVEKDIVIICHGGVIATIMDYLFNNENNFYEWQPNYGRGYTIEVNEKCMNYYKL